jgi:transposase
MGVQSKSTKRKQFSSEFKREAVLLVTESGLSIAQAARDLGLNDNNRPKGTRPLEERSRAKRPTCVSRSGTSTKGHPQDEELARLRRENEVLRQEREILKKPSALPTSGHPSHSWAGNEGDALSIHPRASRPILHNYSVADAGGFSQRLLSMAEAACEPARPAKGTSGGPDW